MDHKNECYSTQFIDGNGAFSADKLDNFIKEVELEECGSSYAVVAIMGPQSSGKSTLLNHLFHTNFREMNAEDGRYQTTRGIWIARCVGIEPRTIVIDLEGTDGSERGEDDTAFEKQSALFSLAIADIVLINIWCHDIGREHASNKPLLRTIFMAMFRLFRPRKSTLMFVVRDKTKTPVEKHKSKLKEDIQRIWDCISKPEAHKHTQLSDVFNIQVLVLDSYEQNEKQFRVQVASLRQKFIQSIAPGGLAGDRQGVVPASDFSFSAQRIWKVIKENKDLDLPAHKIMVATFRCEVIANETYSSFVANKDWLELVDAIQANEESEAVQSLLSKWHNKCLSSYDDATSHYETSVRLAKRKQLEEKLVQVMFRVTQEAKTKAKKEAKKKAKKGIEKNWIDVAASSVIVAASSVIVAAAAVGVVSLGPAAPVVAIPVVAITAKVALIVTITLSSFWKKKGGKEVKVTGKVALA